MGGNFNTQTWLFEFTTATGSFTCIGFGSLEIGFTGGIAAPCSTAWKTGASGDSHAYPYGQFDQVPLTIAGADGIATVQLVCPDAGAAAACLNLV